MGRPRSVTVVRDKSGKSRGEPEHVVKSVVWAQRAKEMPEDQIDDPLAGYCLGRLMLAGRQKDICGISEDQFNAGWEYATIVRRHASIMGYSLGVRAASMETGGGISTRMEPDEKVIFDTRRKFNDCYRALMDVGLAILQDIRVATATYDVCLDRVHFFDLIKNENMLGNVKIGLNVLVRELK